ncbi:MAG: AmmeMemoRadiSam system protein B [Cyclobacteriaceae bacterium]|nr:AmmeMemoRadiSam system protein B [Cyclobacteriaceae bacterium]
MSIRSSIFAGSFYPNEAAEISSLLNQIILSEEKRITKEIELKQIIGGIVPHAGYNYSANEAVHFFHFLKYYSESIDTFIIINPSHSGAKEEVSLDTHEKWNTPFGDVSLDSELMDFMDIPRSSDAQQQEHSTEVILPYLQFFLDYNFRIIPITMRRQSYKCSRSLAEKIYKANQVKRRKIVVIASSDFSHFVRPEEGFYNDNLVINRILNNSIHGLYDTIHENNISVCGYGPIMTLMFYSRMINPTYSVEILARGNSSKYSNKKKVVDYVSALFYLTP